MFERAFTVYRNVKTGEKDKYGKPIVVRTSIGTFKGSLQPVKSAEGEAFVVDTFNIYIERAADLQAGDEIETGGQVYQVDGMPFLNQMLPSALNHWSGAAKRIGPVAA